ncbi:cobalt transporter CbiM [Synechococcales cyanobacterium C]|uniref:Cobalt transporter CbiM n=1 Tax=Petrachloros mirabilis ULC683 TaxID=2781853 RepID=A0A8K2AGS8_9CYAN|nr:cobalt transporter CbiM [Petrachloros mirabilis]NCJ05254.1 cobalt transporter CbiM [Petrachloros mirabilis ULC683]
MHIPDGFLPAQVCAGGYALTGLITWVSLRQIHRQPDVTADIPKAALLTAGFFVASSIHIPVPPTSLHLMLGGLLGAILGYYAFPSILIGLFFQAIMFSHGGLTTLGVNAVIMGVPALIAWRVFRLYPQLTRWLSLRVSVGVCGFLAGALGVGLAAVLFLGIALTALPTGLDAATERAALMGLTLAHLPLMLLEGGFTLLLVQFFLQVKPEMIGAGSQQRAQSWPSPSE